MYDTFECHFKPNQKLQSDMTDPVVLNFKNGVRLGEFNVGC